MFGMSCPGMLAGCRCCCRGARPAWGLQEHAAASLSPQPAAELVPELARPWEGGRCWQPAMCLLPNVRQGRFLLFLSQPWQRDRSLGFILPPPPQRVPFSAKTKHPPDLA